MSTKISVIMPSLNVVSYIEESVKSVLNRTFRDIEILCVDAGSTDGTLEKIKKISLDDKRVILIKSDIKSYGHQVNLGINFAKSEYISIVETDDFICENMLENEMSLRHFGVSGLFFCFPHIDTTALILSMEPYTF